MSVTIMHVISTASNCRLLNAYGMIINYWYCLRGNWWESTGDRMLEIILIYI